MKKVILLVSACLMLFLSGCITENKEDEIETYIVSGTIVEMRNIYSTDIVIETNDGMKVSVYEGRFSDFSHGLKIGDKVCFEVEKVERSGYRIIGLRLEDSN